MEGITILQTVVEKHYTWGFSQLGLFCVIAAIGIFILCLIVDEGSLVQLGVCGAFILGLVGVFIFSAGKELPDTYLYQVIVDDSVPISVFTENYEIKSQEGITYWVVEKEKG